MNRAAELMHKCPSPSPCLGSHSRRRLCTDSGLTFDLWLCTNSRGKVTSSAIPALFFLRSPSSHFPVLHSRQKLLSARKGTPALPWKPLGAVKHFAQRCHDEDHGGVTSLYRLTIRRLYKQRLPDCFKRRRSSPVYASGLLETGPSAAVPSLDLPSSPEGSDRAAKAVLLTGAIALSQMLR